jgi:hypothetical protein
MDGYTCAGHPLSQVFSPNPFMKMGVRYLHVMYISDYVSKLSPATSVGSNRFSSCYFCPLSSHFLLTRACRFSLWFFCWHGRLEACNSSWLIGFLWSFLKVIGLSNSTDKSSDLQAGSVYCPFSGCSSSGSGPTSDSGCCHIPFLDALVVQIWIWGTHINMYVLGRDSMLLILYCLSTWSPTTPSMFWVEWSIIKWHTRPTVRTRFSTDKKYRTNTVFRSNSALSL